MKFKTEAELEEATIPWLNQHFDRWSFQVGCHSYVIDFVGMNKHGIIGIEYKLKHWKRAVEQTWHHQLATDFSYVLMPEGKFVDRLVEMAKNYRSKPGVLIFNGTVEIRLKPKRHSRIWYPTRKMIKERLDSNPLHYRRVIKDV